MINYIIEERIGNQSYNIPTKWDTMEEVYEALDGLIQLDIVSNEGEEHTEAEYDNLYQLYRDSYYVKEITA